jgi:hypothetical protein
MSPELGSTTRITPPEISRTGTARVDALSEITLLEIVSSAQTLFGCPPARIPLGANPIPGCQTHDACDPGSRSPGPIPATVVLLALTRPPRLTKARIIDVLVLQAPAPLADPL